MYRVSAQEAWRRTWQGRSAAGHGSPGRGPARVARRRPRLEERARVALGIRGKHARVPLAADQREGQRLAAALAVPLDLRQACSAA